MTEKVLPKHRNHPQEERGVSDWEKIEAVLQNPWFWDTASQIPEGDKRRGGRPNIYPRWLLLFFDCLADIFDSARNADTQIAVRHGIYWPLICDLVVLYAPDPAYHLPAQPPSRSWYVKTRDRLLKSHPELLDALGFRTEDGAVQIALTLGLLQPDGPGTPSHPDKTRLLHVDGKVVAAMYGTVPGDTRLRRVVNTETGEITKKEVPIARWDADATKQLVGGGAEPYGNKFWHSAVAAEHVHEHVILQVRHVPDIKHTGSSENHVALAALRSLAPKVPGALGVLSDNVFHGKEIDRLEQELGWVVINPTAAAKLSADKRRRVKEKEGALTDVAFAYPDGSTDSVAIWYRRGRLHRAAYLNDGTIDLSPLTRLDSPIEQNPDGTYRTYVEYEVPDPRGGPPKRHRERTYNDAEDEARGFNRAENVRQIPFGDPDYERLYGRRSNAESVNRRIDDELYLRRARTLGYRRQHLNLIAHQIVVNSVALKRCDPRTIRDTWLSEVQAA